MTKGEAVGIALLFCDYLIDEKNSNKKTLAGVFSGIYGKKFPSPCRPFWIYASFTNLEGEHTFAVNIVFEKTKNVLLSIGGNLTSKGPDGVIELALPVNNLMLPEPGPCGVTLHIDGTTIMNRTLYLNEVPKE